MNCLYIQRSLKGSENFVNLLILVLTYYNHRVFEIKASFYKLILNFWEKKRQPSKDLEKFLPDFVDRLPSSMIDSTYSKSGVLIYEEQARNSLRRKAKGSVR